MATCFTVLARSTRARLWKREYLQEIYPADGLCAVFRTPIMFGNGRGREDSPSLDRRVPELGYVPGNVSFISNRANRIKGAVSLPELERLVAHVKGSNADKN